MDKDIVFRHYLFYKNQVFVDTGLRDVLIRY